MLRLYIFLLLAFLATASAAQERQTYLYDERDGVQVLAYGCPTPEHPLILDARVPEQLNDIGVGDLAWFYSVAANMAPDQLFCALDETRRIPVEGRIKGQPYFTGVIQMVRFERPNLSLGKRQAIETSAPTAFERFLVQEATDDFGSANRMKLKDELVVAGRFPATIKWDRIEDKSMQRILALEQIKDQPLAPDELAIVDFELAKAYDLAASDDMLAGGQSKNAFWHLSEQHYVQAALLGHPIAQIREPGSKRNYDEIWSALHNRTNGNTSDLGRIGAALAENRGMIFQSAEMGYVEALALVSFARRVGVELTALGATPSALPTDYDIEVALNRRLKGMADTGELLFNGVFTLPFTEFSCDGEWCRAPIATYFRLSRPMSMNCAAAGNDAASCDIQFRIVVRVDFGEDPGTSLMMDFGNALLAMAGEAAAVSATVQVQRPSTTESWAIIGPIATH